MNRPEMASDKGWIVGDLPGQGGVESWKDIEGRASLFSVQR